MKTIWKYQLSNEDDQDIEAPDKAQILDVQVQNGIPHLWLFLDPNVPVRKYHVKIFRTGHPVNLDHYVFAGTYQLHGGSFIGHVFVA